jgi:t-SNARE complex subunit (syntaxin)
MAEGGKRDAGSGKQKRGKTKADTYHSERTASIDVTVVIVFIVVIVVIVVFVVIVLVVIIPHMEYLWCGLSVVERLDAMQSAVEL